MSRLRPAGSWLANWSTNSRPVYLNWSRGSVNGIADDSSIQTWAVRLSATRTKYHWVLCGVGARRPSSRIDRHALAGMATTSEGCGRRAVRWIRIRFMSGLSSVSGREGNRAERGQRGYRPAVGQQLSKVVEDDDAVTEQAPTLVGVCRQGVCGGVVGAGGARAERLVWAHGLPRSESI